MDVYSIPTGDGGDAGRGTDGSDGGRGGEIHIRLKDEDSYLLMAIPVSMLQDGKLSVGGGRGGSAGKHGQPGNGGEGGRFLSFFLLME